MLPACPSGLSSLSLKILREGKDNDHNTWKHATEERHHYLADRSALPLRHVEGRLTGGDIAAELESHTRVTHTVSQAWHSSPGLQTQFSLLLPPHLSTDGTMFSAVPQPGMSSALPSPPSCPPALTLPFTNTTKSLPLAYKLHPGMDPHRCKASKNYTCPETLLTCALGRRTAEGFGSLSPEVWENVGVAWAGASLEYRCCYRYTRQHLWKAPPCPCSSLPWHTALGPRYK